MQLQFCTLSSSVGESCSVSGQMKGVQAERRHHDSDRTLSRKERDRVAITSPRGRWRNILVPRVKHCPIAKITIKAGFSVGFEGSTAENKLLEAEKVMTVNL